MTFFTDYCIAKTGVLGPLWQFFFFNFCLILNLPVNNGNGPTPEEAAWVRIKAIWEITRCRTTYQTSNIPGSLLRII